MSMSPAIEAQLVLAAVLLLALASAWEAPVLVTGRVRHGPMFGLLGGAILLLGVAIAGRWWREGQGPFLTFYDVLLSNVFSLAVVFFVVCWRTPAVRIAALLACPFLFIMGIWLLNVPATAVPLPATFDNYWLWLHVLNGKLFLGMCLVSACSSCILLCGGSPVCSNVTKAISDALSLDRMIWALFFLAFVFHSFMLVAGSVWAHSAWGRYWSWDTLETWTLITWIVMGGVLHVRATFKDMLPWIGYTMIVVAFVIAFVTFFGVPFLSMGPHKGVM